MNPNLGTPEHLKTSQHKWGTETFLHWSGDAVVKILFFYPKEVTPYCYHLHRSKSLYVGYGTFILRCTDPRTGTLIEKQLKAGCQYKLDPGIAHQIQLMDNEGHIIETSKPYYSDDLYLLADTLLYTPNNSMELKAPSLR